MISTLSTGLQSMAWTPPRRSTSNPIEFSPWQYGNLSAEWGMWRLCSHHIFSFSWKASRKWYYLFYNCSSV